MKKNLRQLIIMLCLMAAPLGVKAQSIVFHLADGDRTITLPATFTVTPADDLLLIGIGNGQNLTLSKDDVQYVTYRDADGSQRVDVADVATIVSLLIGSAQSSGTAPANVEAVDLGLPSGTLWANMNIGATKPEDYGDYFAWGETETKDEYSRNTYGYTGNKAELDLEDDAAHVNWGSDWRMPTREQFAELINTSYTTTEWTNQNGVFGRKITSRINGNSIFLPAAGYRNGSSLSQLSSDGYYWSRSDAQSQSYSLSLHFTFNRCTEYEQFRQYGLSVRPVRPEQVSAGAEDLETVDLGLTSGTLWANMNVGASSPEDYGDYFAWGETTGYVDGKLDFDWSHYFDTDDDGNSFKKYYFNCGLTELDLEDDAAYVNWGADWRMPSRDQIDELRTECTWTLATRNGVNGYKVTGPNGKSIFLPAAGYRFGGSLEDGGSKGYYWSRTFYNDNPLSALTLDFDSNISTGSGGRCSGRSVRPVRSGQASAAVEAVNLGLPSGTKWANMNVGASSPEDYGDYFAWGETETKNEYGVSTYKWCNGSYTTMTKYCSRSEWGYNGFTDNKTQLDPEDDAAYVNLGSDWCMPTYANIQELLDNCTTEWTTINSVNGWKFTGPNGNSIFLPAAGCINADSPSAVGMWGYYWSSTFSLNEENEDYAWMLLGFPNSGADRTSAPRDIGRSVRPVRQD